MGETSTAPRRGTGSGDEADGDPSLLQARLAAIIPNVFHRGGSRQGEDKDKTQYSIRNNLILFADTYQFYFKVIIPSWTPPRLFIEDISKTCLLSVLTPFSAAEYKFTLIWDDSKASDAAISPLTVQHGQDKLFPLCVYHTLSRDVASAQSFTHTWSSNQWAEVYLMASKSSWWHWEIIAVFISALRWIVWQKNPFKCYLVSTHAHFVTRFRLSSAVFPIFKSIWGEIIWVVLTIMHNSIFREI